MAASDEPRVLVEKLDPEGAKRPGFSLGGADGDPDGELPDGGPVQDPAPGAGRATGGSKLAGEGGEKG